MKTVLCSLPYGMAFRNIVCCGIIARCLTLGNRVTLLLPSLTPHDLEQVMTEAPDGVDVLKLLSVHHSPFFSYLKMLKQHWYSRRTELDSFQIRYRTRRKQRPLFHWLASMTETTSAALLTENTVDDLLARAKQPHEAYYLHLLEQTRTDLVLITKPGYHPEELPLIKAARVLGVPIVSIDTTWDNMVSKRPPYLRPDGLTVWNTAMSHEAIGFYGFRAETAVVTGGAQFDIFSRPGMLPDRASFVRGIGLDPARKLIVFTLNSPVFTPDNARYIRLLADAMQDGRIQGGPNLVIRIHPWDRWSTYDDARNDYPRLRIERPFALPERHSIFECLPTKSDVIHYGALMEYADVLINVASTTSLDAMATDTPVVNIGFDLQPAPDEVSVARFYNFSHYRPILETGAVRLARSPREFFGAINGYLADPEMHQKEREDARSRFLTFRDGQNADRVARAVQKFSEDGKRI